MKKGYISLFFLLIIRYSLFSQIDPQVLYRPYIGINANTGLHDYGDENEFEAIQVADDFGPRQLFGNLYDWHGGIDYNAGNDLGHLLLAVQGGNIHGRNMLGQGTKSIIIEGENGNSHIAYRHLFLNSDVEGASFMNLNGCILRRMDEPYNDPESPCLVLEKSTHSES